MPKVSSMVELLLFATSLQPSGEKYQSSTNSEFFSFRRAYWEGHRMMMFPTLTLSSKSFIFGFFFSRSTHSLSASSLMRNWASLSCARQTPSSSSENKALTCCLSFHSSTHWLCSAVHIWTRLSRICSSLSALVCLKGLPLRQVSDLYRFKGE
ncbi:hypothetical protein PAXRUDRAFT_824449 [Paxillus rubicundulus Ve08.2h10]|uniref:Uncharacterized protein n=1 Tax=Paxillus rubicundulus Ve08.2h10 TaxID=930991 RepID=A0A0D0DUF5_9AGAM|nr:hypothetical protein PAXRUDRAFT_824449 [Paxillus rubicundulus Ve08.2h10]